MRIGIWLFDDAEELDWAGPWEVLAFWAREVAPAGEVEVVSFAAETPVRCRKGLRVVPDVLWEPGTPAPAFDVVLVPGGEGTRPLLGQDRVREALRGWHGAGTLVTSVCSGSLLLADAGLLAGREAATHWSVTGYLEALGATAVGERWVDLGDVVTAAGVSAGIDMALHLVRRLAGEEVAGRVRRGIQYDPEPPVENVAWTTA